MTSRAASETDLRNTRETIHETRGGYSARSASTGSIRAARRAGPSAASVATASNVAATAAMVRGSEADTPTSRL